MARKLLIKVCGMRRPDNISAVAALPVDMIGFIFCPASKRCVDVNRLPTGLLPDEGDADVCRAAGRRVRRVGVFVDATVQEIVARVVEFGLDAVQLHGTEPPAMIRNLRATVVPDLRSGLTIMKAVGIASEADIDRCGAYDGVADMLVLDTKCAARGGSGRQFDWTLLNAYHGSTPFLLSGGIGPDDARRVCSISHPQFAGVDLNSRFETEPGVKDVGLLERFIGELEHTN